ncbi:MULTISPECIES: AIR synthase-related protein [Halolamina]|uniref:Hydrogenase maturation factor n=1 Tax=Halolamina pelagica TaxID=699431 RepID=A0A1I5MSU6_9EURY|nr:MULTISPECIES: AIR synthase-related protein [Halolamina]NHX36145.1 hydrogenase expression protein [Halolamina sp. R1-12]SFP12615.1 Hydrogenase maturation factor [Halolamina pelagica]
MPDRGKIDPAFFAERIAPRLGAERNDVALGPTAGVDFGLLNLDGTGLAVATDPISVLPELGFERAGRFALHVALSDVAVAGVAPSHLAISFSLPESVGDDEFDALWTGIHEECEALGTSIVTGHTARYPGAEFPWVGAATAMGVCDPETVVRPDGARPGDRLLVTRGPAVETAGLFASLYPEQLGERGLAPETVADAADGLDEARLVRDAVAAAEAGDVSAMHDATEGGLLGACCEMAASAGVRFEIDAAAAPTRSGVAAVCDVLGIDPWTVTSSGTLVLAVPPADAAAVRRAIDARGTPVAEVGRVVEGSGVRFRDEEWTEPPRDESWDAYAELAGTE